MLTLPSSKSELAVGLGAILFAALLVAWYWGAFSWPGPSPDLPSVNSIRGMRLRPATRDSSGVEIASNYWQPILDVLATATLDSRPMKWDVAEVLELSLRDGSTYHIDLYETYTVDGAFSAGENWNSRQYYRGGSATKLLSVLSEAQAGSQREPAVESDAADSTSD